MLIDDIDAWAAVFRHRLSKVLSAFHAPPDETGQNSEDSDLDDGVDNEEMRRLQTERA